MLANYSVALSLRSFDAYDDEKSRLGVNSQLRVEDSGKLIRSGKHHYPEEMTIIR
jgi:hypothetical protein